MLFHRLREQVEQLIPVCGVGPQASSILSAFDVLCGESLRVEAQQRAPELSRINVDGTPFQFALSLDRGDLAALQFLGEAGRPGCGMRERLQAGNLALAQLADICALTAEAEEIAPLLRRLAPEQDRYLLADSSGIFWFALSFQPHSPPAFTVYVNGRWGPETCRWGRFEEFARFFDCTELCRSLFELTGNGLAPLGMALTLRAGQAARGRLYLSSYGLRLGVHRCLFLSSATGEGAGAAFDCFARSLLGDEARFPTRSAVLSIELAPATVLGAKFELCAHCAFEHDVAATRRISGWLHDAEFDHRVYDSVLATVTTRRPLSGSTPPGVHAYVGIGARGADQYASIYLNPGPGLEDA